MQRDVRVNVLCMPSTGLLTPFRDRRKKKKKNFCHVVLTFGEIFEEILIPFLDPAIMLRRPRWVCETPNNHSLNLSFAMTLLTFSEVNQDL